MDYKSIMSYLKDKCNDVNNIVQKLADSMFPSELEFAVVGVPNKYGLLSEHIGYGGIAYFSNGRKAFDRTAGVYADTKKRPHGLQGNNHGIEWENVSDFGEKAKLILEATSLKKSDRRYKHTRQPSRSDINWARNYLGNHK